MLCNCGHQASAYLADQDELRFGVTTAIANIVVGCSGLLRNAQGEIVAFDMRQAVTADRVETVLQQNIGTGHIMHCQSYLVSGTNIDRGIFVNARIVRESGAIDQPQYTLFSGYLDGGHQPSFPYDRLMAPLEGPGRIRSFTGTNPAAGVEITESVPAGAAWRIISMLATLATDANAANRQVRVLLDDGANIHYEHTASASVIANSTLPFCFSDNGVESQSNLNLLNVALPTMTWLPAGHRIRTNTVNLQAGDNWTAPIMLVVEWLVP